MENASAQPVGVPASEELEVPAEMRGPNAGSTHAAGCLLAAIFILVPTFAYFGFFGLLLLDDLVFETHWVGDNLPPQVLEWLVIIYWPLILVMQWALGIN
jgi:hypothetical protein